MIGVIGCIASFPDARYVRMCHVDNASTKFQNKLSQNRRSLSIGPAKSETSDASQEAILPVSQEAILL